VVPSLLKALLAEPGFAECRSLRQVFCGGEALDAAVAQTFFAQCSARLHNLYGPTEAAIDATWWTCDPDDRRPIPIGRPIANMQAHVLDEVQQPVPVGVAGELYLGGVGLARGYLGRPDLTAEKFVAHPFGDAPGARLYRTGDRARWREDGSIEFLSRVDHQIKLRGFRIEPGEIEEVLRSLPGIRDAVVTLREDRPGDARLVAHVVTEDGRSDSIDLRAQLERMLPAHMVPSAIVALKALPLTAHGKIDRAALPAPASVAAPHDAVAPRTPEEQALAGIWCDILGLQDVGIRQNFFDLGGHSLLAVQLVNRLRRMFACDVPLRIVFDSPTIERMAADCRSLFEGIVDAAEPELNEGRVLTPEVRRRVLVEWNATAVEYPRHATLASLFEAQVARRPDAVALVYGELTVSYAELNAQANRIAHALRASGVGPDVRVGLYLERSVELVAGVLGILKAGGAYVPLDPSYPPARLAFMLEDTAAPMVLAMQARQPALPAHAIRVLCLDDEAVLARHSPDNPAPVAGADCLAYVIYTSGSTGQPKGVMVEQRSVARLVCGANYASFGADETFLLLAPLAFDASTFELWGALLHGARCVLHPEPVPTAAGLEAVIAQHGVSTLWLTAALFNAVIDERPHALRGLRQLLTGGEALSVAHVRRALAALPGVRLINGYGPTESTTFACCHPIPTDLPASCGSIPIGRPIANTEVFVLDTQRQPVPVGVEGELYIGGAGLARGYLGRAELTAEKFVAHPFSEVPGARLYRTGDRVRWRADGVLEFLGRFDHQVKLRGFRIEPGEIEAALCALPGVAQAAVLLREDRAGERRLVAYVCGQGTDAEALRAQLAQDLPAHMLPSAIVVLDALPLTANGKLDRAALPPPAPEHAGSAMYSDDRLPRDIVERHLLGIWESMFERSDIAVDQDFFAIGGHSLLAVRLVDAIARTFGTRLPLDTFWFRGGTIRDIAAVLRESGGVHWPLRVAIRPGGDRPPLFCLHTIGGNLFHYFDLARALAPGQPVFGLNALGVDGRQAPRCRVGDIAADCIAAMREVQPLGPYRLAGFSSGGMVAFEMAQQLRAAGESVSVLALIDTYAPGVHLRVPGGGLLERVGGRLQPYMNRQRLMHALLNTIGRTPRRGFPDAASAHWWAHWSYRPRHYPGRVDLYVAEESRREASRPCLGWSDVASGLHIHPVAGSHGLMVKQPVVQDLARQLQLRLDEAMPVRDEGGAP
jgi:amino acid adenylation domain-containing protein